MQMHHSEFAYDNYLSLPLLRKCWIDSGWTRQTETVEIMYSTTMCKIDFWLKGKEREVVEKVGKDSNNEEDNLFQ